VLEPVGPDSENVICYRQDLFITARWSDWGNKQAVVSLEQSFTMWFCLKYFLKIYFNIKS